MRHLTPAEYAIRCFGSYAALAAAIGCSHNAPLRWVQPGKTRKGTGKSGPKSRVAGDIPMHAVRSILALARERALPIAPADLIYGRDVAEADAAVEPAPAMAGV